MQKKTSFIIFWYTKTNKVLQNRPETNIYVDYKKAPLDYCRHREHVQLSHQPPTSLASCLRSVHQQPQGPFWQIPEAEINHPILEAIARWFVIRSQGRHKVVMSPSNCWDPFFGVKTLLGHLFLLPFLGQKICFWLGVPNRHASSLALNFSTTRSLASRIK